MLLKGTHISSFLHYFIPKDVLVLQNWKWYNVMISESESEGLAFLSNSQGGVGNANHVNPRVLQVEDMTYNNRHQEQKHNPSTNSDLQNNLNPLSVQVMVGLGVVEAYFH